MVRNAKAAARTKRTSKKFAEKPKRSVGRSVVPSKPSVRPKKSGALATSHAIEELRRLKAKIRAVRQAHKGSEYLRAEWESCLHRQIAKEGGLWLPMSSNEYQGGGVWLEDGSGQSFVPDRREFVFQYAEALKPAAEAFRDLARQSGDLVQRLPVLEAFLRPIACGEDKTADLGRWWLALLFREITPKVSCNEADGTVIYGARLDKDVFLASQDACDDALAILKEKRRVVRRPTDFKFLPPYIPPDEPQQISEPRIPERPSKWLFEIRDEVADLVRDKLVMEKFRQQIQAWSDELELRKKAKQQWRFPLPIRTRALTVVEEFVAVAAIHDWLTEEVNSRIGPLENDSKWGPCNYLVLVYCLKPEEFTGKKKRLRCCLRHVKDDCSALIPQRAANNDGWSRHRRVSDWIEILNRLGHSMSGSTFLRRRTGKAVPSYHQKPDSTRESISLRLADLPQTYDDRADG